MPEKRKGTGGSQISAKNQVSENLRNKSNIKILLHFMTPHLFLLFMSLHIISLFITRLSRWRESVRAREVRKNRATARRVERNIIYIFFKAANTAAVSTQQSGTLTLYFVNSKPLAPSSTPPFQICCLLQTFKKHMQQHSQ